MIRSTPVVRMLGYFFVRLTHLSCYDLSLSCYDDTIIVYCYVLYYLMSHIRRFLCRLSHGGWAADDHESMGDESTVLGHAEENLLYLRSAFRPPLCFPFFLSISSLQDVREAPQGQLQCTALISDSCFPSHFNFINFLGQELSSFHFHRLLMMTGMAPRAIEFGRPYTSHMLEALLGRNCGDDGDGDFYLTAGRS